MGSALRPKSSAVFEKVLRGEATAREYTEMVRQETHELLETHGYAWQARALPDADLIARIRRYREALAVCADALKGDHLLAGAHCGEDACVLCWAQAAVDEALAEEQVAPDAALTEPRESD